MIEEIRSKYISVLENTTLLDEETSNYAIKKVKAMDKQVAFGESYFNLTALSHYTDHVSQLDNCALEKHWQNFNEMF